MPSIWDLLRPSLGNAGAPFGVQSPQEQAETPLTIPDRLVQGMGRAAWQGFTAPGNALNSNAQNPVTTSQMVGPVMDLASLMTGFPGTPGGAFGSGLKSLPDTMLGFSKNGPQKAFEQQAYPHTQWLNIDLGNGNTFVDAIKGLNKTHALERANRNWKGADKITPISEGDALRLDPTVSQYIYPNRT